MASAPSFPDRAKACWVQRNRHEKRQKRRQRLRILRDRDVMPVAMGDSPNFARTQLPSSGNLRNRKPVAEAATVDILQ